MTGKWVKARYVAERGEMAARYAEWEIVGPPEIGDVDPGTRFFTPWKVVPHADLTRMDERQPELGPHPAALGNQRSRSALGDAVPPQIHHLLR